MLFVYMNDCDEQEYANVDIEEVKDFFVDDIKRKFQIEHKSNFDKAEDNEELMFLDEDTMKSLAFTYSKIVQYMLSENEPIGMTQMIKACKKATIDLEYSDYTLEKFAFDYEKFFMFIEGMRNETFSFNALNIMKELKKDWSVE